MGTPPFFIDDNITENNRNEICWALCAGPSGRAVLGVGLRPLVCWDCGFESRRGHGCLSVVSVVCCQVEVSATGWSLVQRSPTDCGVPLCVISKNLKNEEAIARDWAASARGKKKKWWLYVQLLPTWKLFWLKPHQFVCVIILLFTMTCPKANYPFSRPYFSSLQGTKREIRRADLQSLYGLGI